MKVPTAVLKFCSAEAARVAAVDVGSTVAASITLGLVTSRNLSEQAAALTTSAVPIRMRETARRMVCMTVLGGSEGDVEPKESPLRLRQREEILAVEIPVLGDDLRIRALVVGPEPEVLHCETDGGILHSVAHHAEKPLRNGVASRELAEPNEITRLNEGLVDVAGRGRHPAGRHEGRLARRVVAVAAQALA